MCAVRNSQDPGLYIRAGLLQPHRVTQFQSGSSSTKEHLRILNAQWKHIIAI
ncbi:hypothetical protein FIBSPDRAFT_863485 [Athelia psychrophila]|uniref:Uncharacterized protein n=1 Tax=Athelia psychrophila TaxID=1759441 RepID=A0A166HC42_9AGAM|nr:hypothetical protein FIBSPDRAFT_863485 [Fibularhizoctonia sp. CBS 109695]